MYHQGKSGTKIPYCRHRNHINIAPRSGLPFGLYLKTRHDDGPRISAFPRQLRPFLPLFLFFSAQKRKFRRFSAYFPRQIRFTVIMPAHWELTYNSPLPRVWWRPTTPLDSYFNKTDFRKLASIVWYKKLQQNCYRFCSACWSCTCFFTLWQRGVL